MAEGFAMKKKRPLVIAHRGFSSRHPENTMEAIRAAIQVGADMVEVDVQETRDGEIVVFHDYRLDRIYGVRKRVRDALRRELPGSPTLKEVLRLEFPLLVEIKGADPVKVASLVRGRNDVIVFSVHPGKVRKVTDVMRFGLAAGNLKSKIENLKCVAGWGLSRRIVTRAMVRALHRRGQKVFVWTVNRAAEMRRVAEWGVDGVITNSPDRALKVLG
jgi:glycerophosphoryl diester phosphodiesterase